MSFHYTPYSTSTSTPAAINNFNQNQNHHRNEVNYDKAEKTLSDFYEQLADHKKKQRNLIQNFQESNYKFDEVTQYFMSQINPALKQTSEQYKEQNKSLLEEISTLKAQLASLQQHQQDQHRQKMERAHKIMQFCDRDINPTEFELFVGALFTALGYRIEHNGKTHDGGIDLIVRHFQKGKGVVQVKQYRKNTKVTEPQMRDLYGAMSAKQEVEYGIMVVLSDCTKEAKTWPEREGVTNLKIWTHKELTGLLEEKGDDTLMEFIRLLQQKHSTDMAQHQAIINSNFVTPKHTNHGRHHVHGHNNHYSNYKSNRSTHHKHGNQSRGGSQSLMQSASKSNRKQHHVGQPSSALSSAKKRSHLHQQQHKTQKQDSDRLKRALLNFGNGNGNGDGSKGNTNTSNNNMDDMRKSWTNFKFSSSGNNGNENDKEMEQKENNIEGLAENTTNTNKENQHNNNQNRVEEQKDDGNNQNQNQNQEYLSPNKQSMVFHERSNQSMSSGNNNGVISSGEPSPMSSSRDRDSSLLMDEYSVSDDDNNDVTDNGNQHRRKGKWNNGNKDEINNSFSNGILSNRNDNNNGNDMNTNPNFLWSLSKNINMNGVNTKQRRARRRWLESDDVLLVNTIKGFGTNWHENTDQWQQIIDHCRFSQQFTLKDVRKHWQRVLKPKLMNQVPSNH